MNEPAIPEPPGSPPPPPHPLAPVKSGERVELLDILRGFAILGILLVNMQLFFVPMYSAIVGTAWWSEPIDTAAKWLIGFVAQGKFYTMFSFLFGMGMAIQMERAEARNGRFVAFYVRRLLWLLVFGLAHAFLVWFGDILAQYALIGFLLIPFRKRKNRTLLVWTVSLILVPLVLFAGITGLVALVGVSPIAATQMEESMAESRASAVAAADEARRVYPTGSYAEILPVRAGEVRMIYQFILFAAPGILAMFLIGLNLGRRHLFADLSPHLPRFRRLVPWLFVVGVLCSATSATTMLTIDQMKPSALLLLQQAAFVLGSPALSFFYILGIALLVQRETWLRLFRPLAAVGRMALTNYIMHSVVFTLIANGYGLGYYGRVRPWVGLVMTLAMFLLQVALSNAWLRRFRFGPLEWVWRSLSYREFQPLSR